MEGAIPGSKAAATTGGLEVYGKVQAGEQNWRRWGPSAQAYREVFKQAKLPLLCPPPITQKFQHKVEIHQGMNTTSVTYKEASEKQRETPHPADSLTHTGQQSKRLALGQGNLGRVEPVWGKKHVGQTPSCDTFERFQDWATLSFAPIETDAQTSEVRHNG